MRLWPRFLTYGHWGGAGWSGGEWRRPGEPVRWDVEPVDDMDAAFRIHDLRWQTGITTRREADELLAMTLRQTNVRGAWANAYRAGAMVGFWIAARLPWRR